ncbi:TPT-domain-containing protein [Marasmius fiardii PR-910]|nr:TPT-domain-containing protein [Marasmius fiardii PR-910]
MVHHNNSIGDKLGIKETFWGANRPLIPINERGGWDEKHGLRDSSSFASRAYSRIKRYASRYWSQRATPIMTTKPTNLRFIFLCALWYTSSALSSNTGKAILIQFRYPITLTFVQFGFVAFYCLLFMSPLVRFSRLRSPTKAILKDTLVMGMFQVGGHIFSSIAISRIPVSTVHTIKALSPLFTVAAYALLFGVSYTVKTYTSLLPLTIGVMLACSFDVSASNAVGLLCAFGSALVFVSSNIFFKKIMPSSSEGGQTSHKLDKINLLFYCSSMAFLLMIPVWMFYDLPVFLSSSTHVAHPSHGHTTPHSVTYYFVMNGTVHFAQNIIAFVILSSTSPVTYSIASLIKRVAVICIAIVWFKQTVHPIQAFGIVLTFAGLYMYNSAKADVERGEKKMRRVEAVKEMMLPSTKAEARMMAGDETPPEYSEVPLNAVEASGTGIGGNTSLHGRPRAASQHHHSRPPPLSVKIIRPNFTSIQISPNKETRSPNVSYPSPPLSLDSPPSQTAELGNDSHQHNTGFFHPPRTNAVVA